MKDSSRKRLIRWVKWVLLGIAYQVIGWVTGMLVATNFPIIQFTISTAIITNLSFVITEVFIYKTRWFKRVKKLGLKLDTFDKLIAALDKIIAGLKENKDTEALEEEWCQAADKFLDEHTKQLVVEMIRDAGKED